MDHGVGVGELPEAEGVAVIRRIVGIFVDVDVDGRVEDIVWFAKAVV